MLKPIACFILIASLASCSKNSHEIPVGSVSFTADGTSYNWTEENRSTDDNYLAMYISSNSGKYYLTISSSYSGTTLHPARGVELTIETGSLTLNTPFTCTNTVANPYYPPHQISVSNVTTFDPYHLYNASQIGDFATVTITKVHDNMVDGTFTAKLHRASDSHVIDVTNGVFKNVDIQ